MLLTPTNLVRDTLDHLNNVILHMITFIITDHLDYHNSLLDLLGPNLDSFTGHNAFWRIR